MTHSPSVSRVGRPPRAARTAGLGSRVPRRNAGLRPPVWFYLPALFAYGIVVVYPSIAGVLYSFTDWKGTRVANFVGLENYRRIIDQPGSLGALFNTLGLTLMLVLGVVGFGLVLALILNSAIRARNVFRLLFFLPVIMPSVVVSVVWMYMYTPGGPLNTVLEAVGLERLVVSWLGDPDVALWSIGASMIWGQVGIAMVIYLAGLQRIPQEMLEAAQLDGAGLLRRFWSITRPLLAPATTIVIALMVVLGMKTFDQVFIMTAGGPGYATQTLSFLVFMEGILLGNRGYATALACVLTILVAFFAFLQINLSRRLEVES